MSDDAYKKGYVPPIFETMTLTTRDQRIRVRLTWGDWPADRTKMRMLGPRDRYTTVMNDVALAMAEIDGIERRAYQLAQEKENGRSKEG